MGRNYATGRKILISVSCDEPGCQAVFAPGLGMRGWVKRGSSVGTEVVELYYCPNHYESDRNG